MAEMNEKLLKLVERLSDPEQKFGEDELTSLLTKSHSLCRVPPLHSADAVYNTTDFDGVASQAEVNLAIIIKLLNYVSFAKRRHGQQLSHAFLQSFTVTCVLAACEYCDDTYEWSSPAAATESKKIMSSLCELYGCDDMKRLFSNSTTESKDSSGTQSCGTCTPLGVSTRPEVLKATLQRLSSCFNKDNWKQYPSLKMSYFWILRNIEKDELGEHLAYLLPPALFILDDWENRNKLLGLQCIQHILNNTVGSELRWYGRAAVIWDAMKPLLYLREPEVLSVLYPTITQVAQVLEADPAKAGKLHQESTLDFIMGQLLQEMSHEQKLSLRAVYASALPDLVEALRLHCVRWSKELLDVCEDYLSTSEGSAGQDRINILKALQHFIKTCWPQVHKHAAPLLKMALRLLYDVTEEGAAVEPESVQVITEEVRTLVVLLHAAAPNTVRELCVGLDSVELHPRCSLVLREIHSLTLQQHQT